MMCYKNIFHKIIYLLVLMISVFGFNIEAKADSSIDTTFSVTKTITSAPPKVNNTFTYKITPDTSNPGIITGLTDSFEIKFENINCSNGIAILNKNISLNSLIYSKPGDYKLIVEEVNSSDPVSYPISNEKWDIVLSIRYRMVDGIPTRDLIVKSIAIFDKETGSKDNDGVNFISDAVFSNIHIFNDTKGNMADLNKYFKIKVNIEGNPGDVYTVSGQDPTIKYDGKMISTSSIYTVGDTPQYIYLKDDQDVTIGKKMMVQGASFSAQEQKNYQEEIRIGTKYSVQEIGSEAYKTYINNSEKPNKNSKEYTLGQDEGVIKILNIYNAEILTGNFVKIIPYLAILLIAIIGLILLIKKRKISEEN